ncbi:hypothetical protein [Desulfuromonas sp. TF]|uniref:hypothetical protein n=1 Tax=Desulfuromonas sp. TF TaxID=1232410 RepID=UPI000413702F|nr:hypothetical protein [Desulfuromonas sp. TF]
MKRFFSVLVLCLVLALAAFPLLVAPCYAMEEGGDLVVAGVLSFVRDVLAPLAVALLSFLLSWLAKKAGDKFKLDFLKNQEDLILATAKNAVGFVEEYAAKRLKEKGESFRLTGSDKLDLAASRVMAAFPKIDPVEVRERIEAVLGRSEGAGATGRQAIK